MDPSVRRELFLHQDGLILSMVLRGLRPMEGLERFRDRDAVAVGELCGATGANPAYLQVALRCLAQQGWLARAGHAGTDSLVYSLTPSGARAAGVATLYTRVGEFLCDHPALERDLLESPVAKAVNAFRSLVELSAAGWAGPEADLTEEERQSLRLHLNGAVVLGLMLALWRADGLAGPTLRGEHEGVEWVRRFFAQLGWTDQEGKWNPAGRVAASHALHYGMVGSYFPMLVSLPRLIFSGANHRSHLARGEQEQHVDRRLNVLASGVAHQRYFRDAEVVFTDLFNREPLSAQPRFVADMGCGDGTWLRGIFELVRDKTKRGAALERYPLTMIGADYNTAALEVTRETLRKAAVPHELLFGDITDPALLAEDLRALGYDIEDGLHIRSFIDHNRQYRQPEGPIPLERRDASTGAYVDADGQLIPNALLERDLVLHLQRWAPFVRRHGLVILEAHCVDPAVAARNVGELHNVVFDTYHGFAKQYPVDFEVFMRCSRAAGLSPVLYHQRRYPSKAPFVSISINRLVVPDGAPLWTRAQAPTVAPGDWAPEDTRAAPEGEALHRSMYEGGDLHAPRSWCSNSAGILLEEGLRVLERHLDGIAAGRAPKRLTVVDHRAGTAFSTVELLKALRESGLHQRVEALKVDLAVFAVDVPGEALAKGAALLRDCAQVRFRALPAESDGPQVTAFWRALRDERGGVQLALANRAMPWADARGLLADLESAREALSEEGTVLFCSNDIGPPLANAVLAGRLFDALRERAADVLRNPERLDALLARAPEAERRSYRAAAQKVGPLAASLADAPAASAPLTLEALGRRLGGAPFVRTFEMRKRDVMDSLLTAASLRRLGFSLPDGSLSAALVSLLLRFDVLPDLCGGAAGTASGFNLQWTFGFLPARAKGVFSNEGQR